MIKQLKMNLLGVGILLVSTGFASAQVANVNCAAVGTGDCETVEIDGLVTDINNENGLQNVVINANTANIVANDNDIATNVADIATNVADIATNATDIATNVADIATNVTDIATNVTDIATNVTDIATNVTDIATNVTNIATNTTDIATLNTRVGTLENVVDVNRDIAADGIAMALAAKVPGLNANQNQAFSLGVGGYDTGSALAMAGVVRIQNTNAQLYGTLGVGLNEGKVGASAGIQWAW